MHNKTKKLPKPEANTNPKAEEVKTCKKGSIPAPKVSKATPSPAPELTPNTYGPAKGFLKKVCIIKPLTDKEIPAITAAIALGNR